MTDGRGKGLKDTIGCGRWCAPPLPSLLHHLPLPQWEDRGRLRGRHIVLRLHSLKITAPTRWSGSSTILCLHRDERCLPFDHTSSQWDRTGRGNNEDLAVFPPSPHRNNSLCCRSHVGKSEHWSRLQGRGGYSCLSWLFLCVRVCAGLWRNTTGLLIPLPVSFPSELKINSSLWRNLVN